MRIAVHLLLLADWLQTRAIVADGRETNPLIGQYGEACPPWLYFLAIAVIVMLIPRRGNVMPVVIAIQLVAVTGNLSEGYDHDGISGPRATMFSR